MLIALGLEETEPGKGLRAGPALRQDCLIVSGLELTSASPPCYAQHRAFGGKKTHVTLVGNGRGAARMRVSTRNFGQDRSEQPLLPPAQGGLGTRPFLGPQFH